jgi:hypothetical protein
VDGLLPPGRSGTVLFGDGKPESPIVLYQDSSATPASGAGRPDAERALEALFGPAPSTGGAAGQKLRSPRLRAIDGPSERGSIAAVFDRVAALPGEAPYLVYFTGHGDRNRADLDNNTYALWADDKGLAVRELALRSRSSRRTDP